jgi:hypothetical protein
MAKKKKKKSIRKKDIKKKKVLKKKDSKKKLKKKAAKNKELKNQALKKKSQPEKGPDVFSDHSSNYNVRNALAKLRSLRSPEEVNAFTKGEKRLSVTRAIPPMLRRFTA